MTKIKLTLSFHRELRWLLAKRYRQQKKIVYDLGRRTSIKDAVEAFDVPHTEIGELLVNDKSVDFSYLVQDGDQITILPCPVPTDPCKPCLLRPRPLPRLRFLVDINVARLHSYLRMAGFETLYEPNLEDEAIACLAVEKACLLLSRDRGLLRRKIVTHGHLLRAQDPVEQLAEVIRQYDLTASIKAFSRCMHCNQVLQPVDKEEIIHLLEPLTRKYYQSFSRCPACSHLYWSGSHKTAMEQTLQQAIKMSRTCSGG